MSRVLMPVWMILLLCVSVSAVQAEERPATNPHVWKPKTRSASVFKNGFGFFMREGDVSLRDGWAVAKEIPPAAFGTLAVYSTKKDELVDIVGSGPGEIVDFDGIDAPQEKPGKRREHRQPPSVKEQRLTAARNLNVQLTYAHQGSTRTAAGKLVSVGDEFVVLESSNNNFAVPFDAITRLQILDLPMRVHVAADQERPIDRTTLGIAYLREGITWIPEYSLKVVDDTTAEMTLRGTLLNEAEDLVHCDVNFVVGVPRFAHTQYLAPIAVGQVIRTIGTAVAPVDVRNQIMSRAMISNNAIRANQFDNSGVVEQPVESGSNKIGATLGNLPQLEGPGGTDFTVYTKKDLTIRKGERAIVTLFVKKIKYSHIYRWSPPSPMEHFLVLHNDTGTAWTTGPVLAVSGDRPLSEDLLKYTPKGGRSEIPVTAALNISHEKNEIEASRKFKAHSPHREVNYDLVVLEGELKLKSFEKAPSEIIIQVAVPGLPTEASDDGKRSADSSKLKLLEREGTIRWNVNLQHLESKPLKYKYERYVPSN